jgi:transcriptional regulator with XRE-family HTH domain
MCRDVIIHDIELLSVTRFPQSSIQDRMAKKRKGKMSRKKADPDAGLKVLLAKHIQKVRMRRGITARQAAEAMGMTRTALTQMETGRNHFNAVTLYRLASVLKCDIKDLFPGVPDARSLTDADAAEVAMENAQAAAFITKAFRGKKR